MSLKAFHIIFITASTLLAFGFGAWSLAVYFTANGGTLDFVLGSASVGAGIALIVYGKYFLKKLKNISYL
ncbi:MAG: hypothetical protein ABI651_21775 [Verrucomicrobiota bacterium]